MLIELRIRNLAVIDAVTLPLERGLNVLTGETGAGKSLIVGALSFLLGERAASDRVRAGADRAAVEGVFEVSDDASLAAMLDERGIDVEDGQVVLKREVFAAGRSRAWVNASPVTAGVLAEIGYRLVNIHGQHESRQLLDADAQRDLLDRYAGAVDLAKQVRVTHRRLQELLQRERDLEVERKESGARADYLRFVVREIDEAKLEQGEEEAIDTDIRRLSHAEELQLNAGEATAALAGSERSVLSQLRGVRRVLVAIERIDGEAARWLQSLDDVMVTLDELARDVEAFAEAIEADPSRLRTLEQRRDQLLTLLRKYGPTVDDALATVADSRAQLALVHDASSIVAELSAERVRIEQELNELARTLTKQRREAARRLSKEVTLLLPELGMVNGAFDVTLVRSDSVTSHGSESVQFGASLNAGSETRPLDRIASGGELSRLMLALSTVLARLQHVPTLVFDEIDAGIGGTVAWQVGALMQRVAAHHQVLAISHLAQIAAHADHHVAVQKGAVGAVTTADTSVLTADARMIEIARMLGGDADREVSRAHARELLERGALARTAALDTTPRTNGRGPARTNQRRGKPV
jgi:DNA repair protein RecN (Recombination protein N)